MIDHSLFLRNLSVGRTARSAGLTARFSVHRVVALIFLLLSAVGVQATITVYEFSEPQKEENFKQLVEELRCPKCQNQNIADSDAGIAKVIKDRVYDMVQQGHTQSEITDHMIARYGEFVTYRPPLKGKNLILWFGPVIVLSMIIWVLWKRKRVIEPERPQLTTEEKEKIQQLVAQYGSDKNKPSDID